MMKIKLFILLCIISREAICALPSCHFEHYSTEDGLPQHTVMDILQDHKGFIWFVTWDGLCKFDGYAFTSYKIYPENTYYMKNNRIDHIYEDKYGYLWLQSYDGEAHRFDPKTETFQGLQNVKGFENFSSQLSNKIVSMKSGKTWILSEQTGCICVMDSTFTLIAYNNENGSLKGKAVFNVFEDQQQNTWLLTDNGLGYIAAGTTEPTALFAEQYDEKKTSSQAFFCTHEMKDYIWFGSNNGRIWKYNKNTSKFSLFQIPANSHIQDIRKISSEELLIISSNNGFFIHNINSGALQSFNTETLQGMKSNTIKHYYIDRYENLWIEHDLLGVSKFNLNTHTLKHFNMKLEGLNPNIYPPNFFIIEDIHNRVWVHPRGGGFSLYNPVSGNLEEFYNQSALPEQRFSNMFHAAYSDKEGNLWLCSRSHGLEKVIFDNNDFQTHRLNSNLESVVANDVRAVFEDKNENRWISTKDGLTYVYDKNYKLLGYLTQQGNIGFGKPLNTPVYCFTQDSNDNIWIGTRGDGLYIAHPKKNAAGLDFRLTNYRNKPEDIYSISENSIYSIFEDSQKRIWIGTYGGGLNLAEESPTGEFRFINHRNHLKNYPVETGLRIRFITEDQYQNVYIGTTIGMIAFKSTFTSPESITYKYYSHIPGDTKSLNGNNIHCIKTTQTGDMYIAVFGGGVNKVIQRDSNGFPLHFKSYSKREGLPTDMALSIQEDENRMLWITTENNLTKFNPQTETFETFGEIKRLMTTHNFSEASSFRCQNNEIIFGFSKGILSFFPSQIRKNTSNPYIALEKFRLFNKDVSIGKGSPLSANIDDMNSLVLSHKQNFFNIEYAALDFTDSKNISYAYKLEGFDKDWIYVQKQRVANYTNIPKGKYVFRIKSTNCDGVWVENERQLPITVKPSFWETPWAYFLYFIFFVAGVLASVRILFIIYRLKDKVKMEHELSEIKIRFFTDISHEIRTPLTMITAPLDFLLQNPKLNPEIKYHLQLIQTNTNRLLRLVNQIMDFRKMQHHQLKPEEINMALFTEEICNNFKDTSEELNIHLQYVNNIGDEKLWADKDSIEKILFNLLSNAFKYTPQGGAVTATLYKNSQGICMEVRDNGKGISKEMQKILFKRFASFNEDKNKPSTGIGLHLVKELSDKLGATVCVESEPGKGSVFTVCFPSKTKLVAEEDITSQSPEENDTIEQANEQIETKEITPNSYTSVLIVEDDNDLRKFLHAILAPDYKIYEAENGLEGLEMAKQFIPDFIVSDIMMPEMNGVELLQQLKNNINTSHIPVILLTAKTTIESKLEGLEHGADDYITKPFSVPYFRARIENLLAQRKRLQALYCANLQISKPGFEPNKPEITPQDEIFMQKVMQQIEENMENSDFLIENIAEFIGISRTVFFKKIKSLTGLAPVEFIRDIKIKRAGQLLDTGQFSIKEVTYMIGMTAPAYFRKCFKQKFGVNPTEYTKKRG